MNRISPEALDALIDGIDVRNNFAFLPHQRIVDGQSTPWLTLCNCYAVCLCAGRGLKLPMLKANKQHDWLLSDDGKLAGWFQVDRYTAARRTNLGFTVLVVAKNEGGHGHIAMGAPHLQEPDVLYVTSAGLANIARGRMESSFGDLAAKALFFINTNEKGS